MAKIMMGNKIGIKLCKALGINPGTVQEIELHVSPHEIPHAKITRLILDKETKEIESVLEEYELVVKEDG